MKHESSDEEEMEEDLEDSSEYNDGVEPSQEVWPGLCKF